MRKLDPSSLDWALEHLRRHSDTDKFPVPFELDVLARRWTHGIRDRLAGLDLTQHKWKGERKMLVPKDEFSFRNAAQLDPIDAVLLAALTFEIGSAVERKRDPISSKRVFSYRFAPDASGGIYGADQWDDFWQTSIARATGTSFVLVVDIADFYNQVSHHSIENQLQRCGVSAPDTKIVMNLLTAQTGSISKGIPVGPHPSHLLAETSLIPIDELLLQRGFEFCRYVDDIHVFCDSDQDAQVALFALAGALDQYHKLILNRQKTRVLPSTAFVPIAREKAEDQPINSAEASVLKAIKKYSTGPYTPILVGRLGADDLATLSQPALEEILGAYLHAPQRDYIRLRFLLRRLSQVGVPGAVEFVVKEIASLLPAFSEVARYLNSASSQYTGSWAAIGEALLNLLQSPIAKESEYIQIVLLGLFARISDLDHIGKLTQRFSTSTSSAQREIVLAAGAANADSWLRTIKSNFSRYDPWLRRALVYAARTFPRDERKFWLNEIRALCDPLELEIAADSNKEGA
jgi:hypothetical protein